MVGAAAEAHDVDAAFGERFEVIDGVRWILECFCLIGESVGGEQALPVTRRPFSRAFSPGPTLEIADRIVSVDRGYLFWVPCGPVEREETASAESCQCGPFAQFELLRDGRVECIHGIQRFGCAVKVLDIDVGDMEAAAQHLGIDLRLMAEELGAPVPRISRERFLREDQKGITIGGSEIDASESLEVGLLDDLDLGLALS